MLTFEQSVEMGEFRHVEIPKIVADIYDRYRTGTSMQMEAALAQAVWVGFCRGKGWE